MMRGDALMNELRLLAETTGASESLLVSLAFFSAVGLWEF